MIWKIKGEKLSLQKILLMGILNVTPDSFSDPGKFFDPAKAVQHGLRLAQEGADLLDLGAESTRPGAEEVSAEEESRRILPVLRGLRRQLSLPLSIDTTKPEIAEVCLNEGANIINDVSGLRDSGPEMARVVWKNQAGLILMHRRGNPKTMQSLARYDDVVEEVLAELRQSVGLALGFGISSEQLVVDPGLGFAKTTEQNLEILSRLEKFHLLDLPLLLGPSRKSFIGNLTGRGVDHREYGTAAVAALAVEKGVHLLRVHEVAAMRDVVRVSEAIKEGNNVRTF